jgi:phosphate-selective porin OprO and OprP
MNETTLSLAIAVLGLAMDGLAVARIGDEAVLLPVLVGVGTLGRDDAHPSSNKKRIAVRRPAYGMRFLWLWAGALTVLVLGGCVSVPEIPMGRPAVTSKCETGPEAPAYIARASDENNPTEPPTVPLTLPPLADPGASQPAPAMAPTGSTTPIRSMPREPRAARTDAPKTQLGVSEQPEDVKPNIELRGRINADAILVGQSPQNLAILGPIQDATGFSRARLGAQGTVGDQVDWVAEFDFAGGNIAFKDVYVGIDDLPIIRRVQVGHMFEPFSLEAATSSNYFALVENSPIMALDPARNWGVLMLAYTENERATFQVGAFRSGTSGGSGDDISSQNDMAYDVRATVLPWYQENGRRLFALGTAFSERFPANSLVTINTGPQSNLLTVSDNPGSPFIPKITVPANQQQLFNAEAALVFGALSFQAEWNATMIEQIGGGPVFLNGFYVFASWFVTGENRNYLREDGKFGNVHVRSPFVFLKSDQYLARGPGAWELVFRFAYADFVSPNLPLSNGLKQGAQEPELTAGVNWYLNDYARIMFNYTFTVPVDPNAGPSTAQAFFIRTAIFW